ncbi:unnamed protein product [Mycena citricolor]|uniref:CxC2-like cysteine cluster KDZ transposase-associated domain-containing protein n=1 Tax=Mycena citricolor TaxID=2018698 RepID=A0AAD2HJU0_9AGAR|nr:unnamed protein product [Mycena citricolor]
MSLPRRQAGRPPRDKPGERRIIPKRPVGSLSADTAVYISSRTGELRTEIMNVSRKRKRTGEPHTLDLDSDRAGASGRLWVPDLDMPVYPMDSTDDAALENEGNAAGHMLDDVETDEEEVEEMAAKGKGRKVYGGTVSGEDESKCATDRSAQKNPMSRWRPRMSYFLDELLRYEGLADSLGNIHCGHCHSKLECPPVGDEAAEDVSENQGESASYDEGESVSGDNRKDAESAEVKSKPGIFKCLDCGVFLQCRKCLLQRHANFPLHVIREWNGSWWKKLSLADLGFVYQLGHGGLPCPFPADEVRRMVVIHAPHIHDVQMQYCNCAKSDHANNVQQLLRNGWYPATNIDPGTCATFETLEAFRLYQKVGNMNARDFMTAVEQMTDVSAKTGIRKVVDRYKQLQRMARQWAFLLRVMRAGRGHDPCGVESTEPGECAVICWACPYEGRNLPENWKDVHPSFRFIFMLLLALDANFRLKNRIRANEIEDRSLGPGWGYWVPPDPYNTHLKNYVSEEDTSTCIAFAALLQKDTRLTTGLRVSGVGGCVCARHECMRPNGLGDLQKGERYANMDFIVFSALVGFALFWLTLSYDIGCQWRTKLAERMDRLPSNLHLPLKDITVQCGLPVWHAASHNTDCQNANSLSFKPGVGKTDGEGIERVWSTLNPTGYTTRTAGLGMRADILEEKIDHNNFMKNLGLAQTLPTRLKIAEAERKIQVAAFEDVSVTVPKDLKEEWTTAINEWLADETKPNPYVLDTPLCVSEAQVRLDLRKEEDRMTAEGRLPVKGRTKTSLLTAGIQIEDAQRRIRLEVAGTVVMPPDRAMKLEELRRTVLVKIERFRELQLLHMPAVINIVRETEPAAAPLAENVKLWMPSEMPASLGKDRGCTPELVGMEVRLRVAQCENSLAQVRARLHAKRHLINFRNANVTGQEHSTKARTIIDEIGEKVNASAARYRTGRAALVACEEISSFPHLRELAQEDLQMDGVAVAADDEAATSDAAAARRLAAFGAGRAPRRDAGASKRTMSWIWTAKGALEQAEVELHDSIRVEWARARARRDRWSEEVLMLKEEMRRVCAYLQWQAEWWLKRQAMREDWDQYVEAGARAYALKQAAWHTGLRDLLKIKWGARIGGTSFDKPREI